ncbi:MAG: MFS transporter [Terriglobales bacterium]
MLTGIVTTLLGPILPTLAETWSLRDSQAGFLFTAQFAGSIAGVTLHTLLSRWSLRMLLMVGFVLMALGVGLLPLGHWPAGLAFVFCYGVGLGLTLPSTNLAVSEANPERRAAALNLLNLAWGCGAVAWPLVATWSHNRDYGSAVLFVLGALLALSGVAAWLLLPSRVVRQEETAGLVEKHAKPWQQPPSPLLGLLFFLYVGIENGVAGWASTYVQRMGPVSAAGWGVIPAFFWGALLLGRAAAPLALRWVSEGRLLLMGLGLATCGITGLLMTRNFAGAALSVMLTGVGLAPVFPGAVALLSHLFGASAHRLAGTMFGLAGLGGAVLPWSIGAVSGMFGTLRAGLLVPLCGNLLMIALILRIHRHGTQHTLAAVASSPQLR